MKTIQILKQSWTNVWRYRALWIFGVILALTSFSMSPLMFYGDSEQEEVEMRKKRVEVVLPNNAHRVRTPNVPVIFAGYSGVYANNSDEIWSGQQAAAKAMTEDYRFWS